MLRDIDKPLVPKSRLSALNIKSIFLSILSGILLALPFCNGRLWFVAWFSLLPFFYALRNKQGWRAFFLGALFGFVFWWITIYWLVNVTFVGTSVLILYLSLYFGLFSLGLSLACRLSNSRYLIFIPSLWVILEYLRSHFFFMAFPWALLGYSQYSNLTVIQISDIFGSWGVSFLIVMVNCWIAKVMGDRCWVMGKLHHPSPITYHLTPAIILLLSIGYGFYKLHPTAKIQYLSPTRISVIQGNIPQELKWDASAKKYILDKYVRLTKKAALDKPELIIWPEASSPGFLGGDAEVFQRIFLLQKEINVPLLIGSVVVDNRDFFNSALLINQGRVLTRYDKLHLVPFGEYIPLKNVFPFLETIVPIGDFKAGREYTVFSLVTNNYLAPIKFSTLICFEDAFPELSRNFVKAGAGFLVNVTNDGWYKKTTAAGQHLSASVLRAVENKVWLARCANTGISCFISPSGKITTIVRDENSRMIFVDGYAIDSVYSSVGSRNLGVYTFYGDWFVLVLFGFIIYVLTKRGKRCLI